MRSVDFDLIERPSPNFDERQLPVSMIVLHYTGMPDAEGALDRLTSPEAKVSCHYLVDEDGSIYRLVDEGKRAWHAGKSRWRGSATSIRPASGSRSSIPATNSAIVRSPTSRSPRSSRWSPTSRRGTGSAAATSSAIRTSRRRARKTRANCSLGHALAKRRLALPSPTRDLIDPYWTDAGFLLALERFGYDVTDAQKAVIAFQRRFRPDLIDGIIDGECRAKLLALLLPRPQ